MACQLAKNRELGSLDPWPKVVSGEIFLSLCLLFGNHCLPGNEEGGSRSVLHLSVMLNELTGQQSVLLLSRKRRKQPLSPQLPPLRLFWNSSGPAQWRVVPSALTNAWASCLCCPWLGPSWPPGIGQWGDVGKMPGWAARELWLPGASPGAEQRGHFRRPLCSPLYPEERLQLCRVQSPLGP